MTTLTNLLASVVIEQVLQHLNRFVMVVLSREMSCVRVICRILQQISAYVNRSVRTSPNTWFLCIIDDEQHTHTDLLPIE